MHINQDRQKARQYSEQCIKVREFGGGSDAAIFGSFPEIMALSGFCRCLTSSLRRDA
jgi:hypothetical protein